MSHFLPLLCLFLFVFDNFACVIGSCIHLGTGVYFYWNCTISPPFPLINNLFCTSYKKIVPLRIFWTKMSPLLFLIAVPFNCKIMQFLLIGFHSVGKASKLNVFLPDGAIFSGLAYKVNTPVIPVFCFCKL